MSMDLGLDQQINFLKKIPFFAEFDHHEMRQFLSVAKWLKVPANSLIIKENTAERAFYILVKGRVSVFKTIGPRFEKVRLTTLSTGDCFGEMSLVTEIKRTAGVESITEAYILLVNPQIISGSNIFLQLKFYKRFCEILVSRLIRANERVTTGEGKTNGREGVSDEAPASAARTARKARPPEDDSEGPAFKTPPVKEMNPAGDQGKILPQAAAVPENDHVPKTHLQTRIHADMNLAVNPGVMEQIAPSLRGRCENTRKLAELILLDPVLSARVLQAANSPFYRRAAQVTSVPHAMVTIGIKNIQDLLLDTIEANRETSLCKGFVDLAASFWQHAVIVGRIARLLMDVIRINVSVDVYLAGLLHDLGILTLDSLEPRFYPRLAKPDSALSKGLPAAETKYLKVDHGQAGSILGGKMGLPAVYLEVMRLHNIPQQAREHVLPVALVHLADIFAARRGICFGGPECAAMTPLESMGWVLLQEQHKPFLDVNPVDFIDQFEDELERSWPEITGDLP